MSPWAKKRKMTVYAIILLLLLALGALIYIQKFIKPPTCFDKIKNGDEDGIDCGGSCNFVCVQKKNTIKKNWSKSIEISGDIYNIAASVENIDDQNRLDIKYKLSVFSSNGTSIWSEVKNATLNPLENKIFFTPYTYLGDNEISDTFFEILETKAYKNIKVYNKNSHNIIEKLYSIKNSIPTLELVIKNDSAVNSKKLEIIAILYDENKNIINFSNSIIPIIKPKEKRDVILTWQKPFAKKVKTFDIFINEID